jgi:hypothetical protein
MPTARHFFLEQLHRVAEAHPALLHHPVNRPAANLAAKAVPQVLVRGDDQRSRLVGVERADAGEVPSAFFKHHPAGLDQALHRDFFF